MKFNGKEQTGTEKHMTTRLYTIINSYLTYHMNGKFTNETSIQGESKIKLRLHPSTNNISKSERLQSTAIYEFVYNNNDTQVKAYFNSAH